MTDQEIEELIWNTISSWVKRNGMGIGGIIDLLNCQEDEEGFTGYWNHKENCWDSGDECDPLSLLLIFERDLPHTDYDDNEQVSTAASVVGKSANWVRSFQDGIQGFKNKHTSISGYLMGSKIRNRVLKEIDRKYVLVK